MALNLSSIVEYSACRFPNQVALIHDDRRYTFRDLQATAKRCANVLQALGVERGDHVAVMIPNVPEFTFVYFGILYLGATVVPLNCLLVEDEIAYHLSDSCAKAVVVFGPLTEPVIAAAARIDPPPVVLTVGLGEDRIESGSGAPRICRLEALLPEASPRFDPAQTMPDDTAVILYTSGTTGRPKGAELTHFNLYSNAQWCAEKGLSAPPDRIRFVTCGDVSLAALPLFHSFGQTVVQNGALFHGGALTYLPRWDPEQALHLIERDRVTQFDAVPSMYLSLIEAAEGKQVRMDTLVSCKSGGAPMPLEVLRMFEERFQVPVYEGYGLSETSPVVTFHTPERPRKVGSVGFPIFGCEVRIVDANDESLPAGQDGEVVVRGHNVMKGYYNLPEATAEAMRGDWFHTGDIGHLDEDGYLYIVDRKKDMILRGGFNVYPREVEEVLYAHPAVRECAVIGVPDREHGEEVKAVIVLNEPGTLSEEELRAFCRKKLAAYKYPRIIEFREELPKGPTGKVLKRALREA